METDASVFCVLLDGKPGVSHFCILNAFVICELERVQIMQLDLHRSLVLCVLWWAGAEEFWFPHAEYICCV